MRHILNSVYGLLLVPEVNTPVDSSLALLYHDNKEEYTRRIKECVKTYASEKIDEVIRYVEQGVKRGKPTTKASGRK